MANFDSVKDAGWKYVDSKTGTTAIPLPSEFEELFIMVKLYTYNVQFPMVIPRAVLSTNALGFRAGYYATGSNGYVEVVATTSSVYLANAQASGSDVKNNCTVTVYCK